jgi:preprotein translocase subunit SecE
MKRTFTYIRDSFDEVINKVTWPKFSELQQTSVVVLVASLVFSLIVMGVDLAIDKLLSFVY